MGDQLKLKKVKCKKCGGEWYPRVSAPKKCPGCQTREWDGATIYRRALGPARKPNKYKKGY